MASKVSKPIISIPVTVHHRAIKRQDKLRSKALQAEHSKFHAGDRSIPALIKCRRPELNHFKGQIYAPFKTLPMATEHWMSRRTIGDYFSFCPFRGASATNWHKYLPHQSHLEDSIQFAENEVIGNKQ
jgi:hypothetical protein